jgi:hypothetical protein
MKALTRSGALVSACLFAVLAVGAPQALAAGETTLCKTNQATCEPANQYAAGNFKWKATNTKLITTPGNILCTKATFTHKTLAVAGTPLLGEINAMEFEGCTLGTNVCSVTAINLAWKTETTRTTNPDGEMKIRTAKGEPRLAFSCSGGEYKCVYGAETTVLVHGGNPAEIVFKNQVLPFKIKEGTVVNCPATIEWSANYVAEMPQAVFVTKN